MRLSAPDAEGEVLFKSTFTILKNLQPKCRFCSLWFCVWCVDWHSQNSKFPNVAAKSVSIRNHLRNFGFINNSRVFCFVKSKCWLFHGEQLRRRNSEGRLFPVLTWTLCSCWESSSWRNSGTTSAWPCPVAVGVFCPHTEYSLWSQLSADGSL